MAPPAGRPDAEAGFSDRVGHAVSPHTATPCPVLFGRVRGEQITFTAGGAVYTGRVTGRAMKGTVVAGGTTAGWTADRVN